MNLIKVIFNNMSLNDHNFQIGLKCIKPLNYIYFQLFETYFRVIITGILK